MTQRVSPALVAVLAVLGFLLVTSVSTAEENRRQSVPRKARLIELIEARQEQVDDLDAAVRELRADVARAERAVRRTTELDRAQAGALLELATQAGTNAVTGPGLEVRLADSDRESSNPDEAGAFRIHDRDVQLVINALFASGAEAVAVNDNRIVATSAVRAAGDTVVVNFRPLSPPYRVVAIGADRTEFEASEIVDRFRRWTRLFGLQFTVKDVKRARIPAFAGRVGISTATPVTAG